MGGQPDYGHGFYQPGPFSANPYNQNMGYDLDYEEEGDEYFLDEETEKHYDRFLQLHPQAHQQPEEDEEFQRDFEEFVREQGGDVDGYDSEEDYYLSQGEQLAQQFAHVISLTDSDPQAKK